MASAKQIRRLIPEQSVQLTVENKIVTETLKRIDEQLIRLRTGKGTGMFAAAAYFLAPSLTQARIAASTYKAVISGANTNLESSALNLWTKEKCKEIDHRRCSCCSGCDRSCFT